MKKTILISLVALLVLSLCGCANNKKDIPYADANEVLTSVWSSYAEEEKFMAGGGDSEQIVENAPGNFNVEKTDELDVTLALPAAWHDKVESAASLVNMMNANMFTGAAFKLPSDADFTAFANDFKTNLDSRQWMCGFPEKYVVIQSGDYVLTAFGNADNVDRFKTKAEGILTDAKTLSEGNLEIK